MEEKTPQELLLQINALEDKLMQKQKEHAAAVDSNTALTAQLTTLQSKYVELQTTHATASANLNAALNLNDNLSLEIEKMSDRAKGVHPVEKKEKLVLTDYYFESEGVKYGFKFPSITIDKGKITPVEVLASETLQRRLIESNSAMIYKK